MRTRAARSRPTGPWKIGLALLAVVAFLLTLPASQASAATVTSTFTGTVDSAGTSALVFPITVGDTSVPIQATLDWAAAAPTNLNLFLVGPTSPTPPVAQVVSTAKPKSLTYTATVTGQYKLRVKAAAGASSFTLTVTYGNAAGAGSSIATYDKTFGFADTASIYPYGMAFDSSDNTVLVGDYWNFRVQRFSAAGAKVATYRNSALTGVGAPYDIAIDPTDIPQSGPLAGKANYWVADQEQGVVVEFDHSGNVLHQLGVGGTGSYLHPRGCGNGALGDPTHLTIDPTNGNLLISDVSCKNVWVFAHDGTYLSAFDWTGWKSITKLFTPTPRGLQIDENGTVYVSELNSKTITVFTFNPVSGRYEAKSTFGMDADLSDPRGIDIDTTRHVLYAVGALRQRIIKYDISAGNVGNVLKKWDSPLGTNAVKADPKFNSIRSPAVDPATGNVFFGDAWAYRTWKFDANAVPLDWSSPPSPPSDGGYTQQTGVAVSPTGTLYVTGSFDQRVQAFDTSLACPTLGNCPAFIAKWGTRVNSAPNATGFDYPKAMVYTNGYLWISENDGNDIHAYLPNATGAADWIHRFGLQGPAVGQFKGGVQGIYVGPGTPSAGDPAAGKVFATDVGNCRLQVFDQAFLLANTSGNPEHFMGGCGTGATQMSAPRGVVANGKFAYVIETGSNKISMWDWTTSTKLNVYAPTCGTTKMLGAWDAAWDATKTWIYIGDKGRARVVRWNPSTQACQVVTTGSDTPEGALSGPDFLNFGPDGKLYVSDNNKHVYSFNITG